MPSAQQHTDPTPTCNRPRIVFLAPKYAASMHAQPDTTHDNPLPVDDQRHNIPAQAQRAMMAQHNREMDSNLAYIGAVFPDEDDRDSVVQMDLDLGGVVLEKALVKEIKINPKRGGKVKSGKGKMWSNLKHRK